jgi:hypothetical protein
LENSSFEMGLRHGWWNETAFGRTNLSGLINTDPHSGTYAVTLNYSQFIRSRVHSLRSNHVYTFSFWIKGTNSALTWIDYGFVNPFVPPSGYTNPWPSISAKQIGTSWTRVTLTNIAYHYPQSDFYVFVGVNNNSPNDTLILDDVQLEEGDAATTYAPRRAIEVAFVSTNNSFIYTEGQPLTAQLLVVNTTGNASNVTVGWDIFDGENLVATNLSATVTAAPNSVTTNWVSIDPA